MQRRVSRLQLILAPIGCSITRFHSLQESKQPLFRLFQLLHVYSLGLESLPNYGSFFVKEVKVSNITESSDLSTLSSFLPHAFYPSYTPTTSFNYCSLVNEAPLVSLIHNFYIFLFITPFFLILRRCNVSKGTSGNPPPPKEGLNFTRYA